MDKKPTDPDDDDGGDHSDSESKSITKLMTYTSISDHQRKIKSYSQPLYHDPALLPSSSSSALKKNHSLDADDSSPSPCAARSFSYPTFQSSPHSPEPPPPAPGSLPEFTGTGGGTGIFRLPLRAAMHPGRPPPLELRPHPLRESQVGSFIRTIACTQTQLWAGLESGVRYWSFSEAFGCHKARKSGDDESAPFRESTRTSPTMCLVVDELRGLVWSGHKDGKIRSWKMEERKENQGSNFKEGFSWHAHRCAVLSLAITSFGELWSGSESGVIKAWPWEAIEKSLSLTVEERHMAALSIERSYVDLRSLVTVEGVCPLSSSDVKYMLSDNSRSKVWSGGSLSFALWDSRKKELLKVLSILDQVDTQVECSPVQHLCAEDDMKAKLVSNKKKEKSQGSGNFFQRSRNALLGAADAVRRAAAKGAFGDDGQRTEALAMSVDGMVWTGCTNGSLVQWDGNGNRLQEVQHCSYSVQCLCNFGARLWVGYANGSVQVMDLEGNLLGGWVAHSSSVVKISVGASYIFTLANHGGVRGWYLTSPGPLDSLLRLELANKELLYTKQEQFKILAGTWNVGQQRASRDALMTWLGCAASEVALVVVGLQEVEMGAGFLAMAAAKETVGLEGSANGQWWLDTIGRTLDEGMSFERVGSRQLAGLLIAVWARRNIRPHIGDVDAAAVPCGLGRAIGNKGAVGLRMRVYDRIMCFVNCHFAAHLEAVNKRNADFDHVYRSITFSRAHSGAAGAASVQSHRATNATDVGKYELSEADMIIFLGDFNYRLRGIAYDEARDLVSQRCFDWLRDKDQLRAEMRAGKVFQGLREAQIKFPPTYKFERHKAGLSGYDSGEKKRIPAWCDRILYRDNRSVSVAECSLECPVVSSISQYDACLDVTGSDHKPVRCIFKVEIAHVDEVTRRKQFGEIVVSNDMVKSLLREFSRVPETVVSTNEIVLPDQDASILRITNKCNKDNAIFEIIHGGQSTFKENEYFSEVRAKGPFGFPSWLKVIPSAGIIKPGQIIEVSLRHDDFRTLEDFFDGVSQNRGAEDTRDKDKDKEKDKDLLLVVIITGCWSTNRRYHRIHVRQCSSSKTQCRESNSSLARIQSLRH